MSSIVIGISVAVLVWLFLRVRRVRALQRQRGRDPDPAPSANRGTMPRLGIHGSVTKDQLRRLREFHFEPSRHWSKEEADLILDSVIYLRAAVLQVTGDNDAPEDFQNQILAFILSDESLRNYVISWGENRRSKGYTGAPGELVRNEHFERVAGFIAGRSRDGSEQQGHRSTIKSP